MECRKPSEMLQLGVGAKCRTDIHVWNGLEEGLYLGHLCWRIQWLLI